MPSNNIILEANKLGIDFGGLTAVNNFNLKIHSNEIYGLIGPNGAGKTTVFNLLTKVHNPNRGVIYLNGKDITKLNCVEVSKLGIARTFQNIRLFSNLTVLDNVLIAMSNDTKYSLFDAFFRTSKFIKIEKEKVDEAISLLKIFNLDKFKDNKASSLPYGEQRRLEIVRALATHPCLLLLDEPAAGMNPSETNDLLNSVKKIKEDFNVSILLIEHDMKFVMGLCDYITVLYFGQVLAQGKPQEIQNNKDVIQAYLGGA